MFFWIPGWVSIENYKLIFLQELTLIFQVEHQRSGDCLYSRPFLTTDGPISRFGGAIDRPTAWLLCANSVHDFRWHRKEPRSIGYKQKWSVDRGN
jgi:hypothetical protein